MQEKFILKKVNHVEGKINQFRKPVKVTCQQLSAAKQEGEDMEALFGIILGQISLTLLEFLDQSKLYK